MPPEATLTAPSTVLTACTDADLRAQLERLADTGGGFLGRATAVEPIAAIVARLDSAQARLFLVEHDGHTGLFGVCPVDTNPYQGVIDLVLPGAPIPSTVDGIGAALALCRSHLALRTVLRYGQVADDRAGCFEAAGLRRLGVLRGALYTGGRYRDQPVWFGQTGEQR